MKKMNSKKGFTLMEMLIVVAIIAVLVAIAIPTMTSSLNKAHVASDAANIRSAYATLASEILAGDKDTPTADTTYYMYSDGTCDTSSSVSGKELFKTTGKCTTADDTNVAGLINEWEKDKTITFTVDKDGSVSDINTGT